MIDPKHYSYENPYLEQKDRITELFKKVEYLRTVYKADEIGNDKFKEKLGEMLAQKRTEQNVDTEVNREVEEEHQKLLNTLKNTKENP